MSIRRAQVKYGSTLAAVALLGSCVFVWPSCQRNRRVEAEVAQLQHRLETGRTEMNLLVEAQARLDDLADRFESELKPLPDRADLHLLMKALSEGISELGLSEKETKVGPESAAGTKYTLELTIETSGDFQQLFGLVDHIESLPRLLRIREIKLSSLEEKASTGMVRAMIKLDAFYRYPQALASHEMISGPWRGEP